MKKLSLYALNEVSASRRFLPIVKRQVSSALPDKMLDSSQVHVWVQDLVLTHEFNLLLGHEGHVLILLCLSWLVIGCQGGSSGLGLSIQVNDLLIDVFHHLPHLQHVTGRQTVLLQCLGSRRRVGLKVERDLVEFRHVLVHGDVYDPLWDCLIQ